MTLAIKSDSVVIDDVLGLPGLIRDTRRRCSRPLRYPRRSHHRNWIRVVRIQCDCYAFPQKIDPLYRPRLIGEEKRVKLTFPWR